MPTTELSLPREVEIKGFRVSVTSELVDQAIDQNLEQAMAILKRYSLLGPVDGRCVTLSLSSACELTKAREQLVGTGISVSLLVRIALSIPVKQRVRMPYKKHEKRITKPKRTIRPKQ